MGIITITPGSYTPGAQSSLDAMASVINAAWDQGNLKSDDFADKIAAITAGWLDVTTAPHITASSATAPTVVEPGVDIPATQSATDILDTFTTKYLEVATFLADKFTAFRATYFPDESTTYAAAEAWLLAAINNPDSGLPVAIQNQITADDHARIAIESARASAGLAHKFSAMRFPLMPDQLVSAQVQIEQNKQNLMAESSRKITMQSVDMMKFAVEKALSLRQMALGASVEYIKALASGPDVSSRVVGIGYDAQSKLISSASQFYGARIDAAKLTYAADQFNAQSTQSAAEKNQMSDLTLIEDRLKALLTEAQALAQMATSLFNNVHAAAGTSYSVNGT
ncbi:hypothetical protein PROAA_610057 [Candidatus Propionivibrio aalborgensis]|uniref:Uncharacterized protein n=1 Tax=Candidatus Propionivibrio aalborgensis TaxID=1860101 RepID=A0A1A8Y103_9RHOO|nr:hypothetical protein [Candidatus Propionivibrio aalborgensis]SBT10697.1 hypothetical protein PROAA_610057 [Candidatus Propionivibrio aalborgensis]